MCHRSYGTCLLYCVLCIKLKAIKDKENTIEFTIIDIFVKAIEALALMQHTLFKEINALVILPTKLIMCKC